MTTEASCLTRMQGGEFPPRSSLFQKFKNYLREWARHSPLVLVEAACGIATDFDTYREVRRFLKTTPIADISAGNCRFPFKYLRHTYLAHGFTNRQRAACFLHHYNRLNETSPWLLRRIFAGDYLLYEVSAANTDFAITMGISTPVDMEGEMSLNLCVAGKVVYVISFTIVPGWTVGSQASETILITRIQGVVGCYEQIAFATKALFDVAPASLLIAALQGVAAAFNIHEMAGVPAMRHRSHVRELTATFKQAYDSFFIDLGAQPTPSGIFLSPLPIEEKPMSAIKPGHKLRTRKKRSYKRLVATEIRQAIELTFFDMADSAH